MGSKEGWILRERTPAHAQRKIQLCKRWRQSQEQVIATDPCVDKLGPVEASPTGSQSRFTSVLPTVSLPRRTPSLSGLSGRRSCSTLTPNRVAWLGLPDIGRHSLWHTVSQ